ncbi:hypothetical protein J591_1170 [Acinetobacter baumannii 532279]|nr:hypothetical protein J591_1170 [Acinetobacter baumannii 532279]
MSECEKRQLIFNQKLTKIKSLIAVHDYTNRGNVNLKISGGVSGAIGYTKATGTLVGGSDHIKKGKDLLKGFKDTMKTIDKAHSLCDKHKARFHAYGDPYIRKLENSLALPTKVPLNGKST